MAFVIEVNVRRDFDGIHVWKMLSPSGGAPYKFDTEAEATRTMEMCYPDQVRNVDVRVRQIGANL